jgi:hypothetical protein
MEVKVSEFINSFSDSETLYFNYINDKDGNLYSPKIGESYQIDYSQEKIVSLSRLGDLVSVSLTDHGYITDDVVIINSQDIEYSGEYLITVIDTNTFTYTGSFSISAPLISTGTSKRELTTGQLRFSNKSIDLGLFFGQSRNIFLQDLGTATSVPGYAHVGIKLNAQLNDLDEFKLYHPNGTRSDSSGKYDLFTVANTYGLVPDSGSYYAFNDFDGVVGHDVFYINGTGYLTEIVFALANCLNSVRNRTFTAYAYEDRVFIKLNSAGNYDDQHKLMFYSPSSAYTNIEIDFITGNDLISNKIHFSGGSPEKGNRLVLDAGHLSKINLNLDSVLVKSSDSWSKIRKVSKYIDEITEANQLTKSSRTNAINSYLDKIVVVLDENEEPTVSYKEFIMRPKFRPAFGLLSFFPIKDLDFDFYGSTYTNFPQIDLYNYYFIPEETSILLPGKEYKVASGSISVEGNTVTDGSIFTVSSITSYSIINGSPLVTYYSDLVSPGASLTVPALDQNNELRDFSGFFILRDSDKVVPQDSSDEYTLRKKYLNGLVNSEYDYYKENISLDFALRSKIIPYITKWGIKNGKDTRDNPYRLNTELIFGRNNFSPDHEDRTQNPVNFTHEWFYIESKFGYINDESTISQNTNYFSFKIIICRKLFI